MTSPDRTQEFFHRYAAEFDSLYGTPRTWPNRIANPLLRRSMRMRFELTLVGCQPIEGRTVLDVGCGPGHYAVELAGRGARHVIGLDFAAAMLEIAAARAQVAGVSATCEFVDADFATYAPPETFDYVLLNGFMDYVSEPAPVIAHALSLTHRRAFFSFPSSGGLLAWQRRLRYQRRCDLFLYSIEQVERLFAGTPGAHIRRIARDIFVQVDC
jgi:SAM-dependent methyltransferase